MRTEAINKNYQIINENITLSTTEKKKILDK